MRSRCPRVVGLRKKNGTRPPCGSFIVVEHANTAEFSVVSRNQNRVIQHSLQSLFQVGSLTGVTDGQLLERFARRDGEASESAFAALVERHTPLVWGTCRAVLRDDHDAGDAFQATFLVLVRKAGSLWVCDSIGPWLHRVALRAAIQTKREKHRRRRVEQLARPN